MIETYSKNVTADTNESIALNSVSLVKGCSVTKQGASSLIFNKRGIYLLLLTGFAVADAAGDVTIQLRKNGVLQANILSTVTAADTTSKHPVAFTALIQVPEDNNTNCPCSTPTIVDIVNVGVDATFTVNVDIARV